VPKLNIQTTDEIPSAQEGKAYEITGADEFSSQVRSFKGLRVSLKDSKGETAVEALWMRSPVGPKSKIGCFIQLLGKNTDKWIGKRVRFVSWKAGNRVIALETPK